MNTQGVTRRTGVFVGLVTVDLIHRLEHAPGVNEKTTALAQEIVAGGPAANAAVTFALLGGDARLVTDLGSHPLARLAHDDLGEHGVRVGAVDPAVAAMPAVSSIRVLESTGERSVVSVNAAARTVAAPEWLPSVLDGADVLLLDGHHPEPAVAAARAARGRNVPIVLDAGSWKPVLDELLAMVDVAICSADFRIPGRADTAAALAECGISRIAISRGAEPILWWSTDPRESGRAPGTVAVPRVDTRDTLGAGDVLHGAFAWELAGSDAAFPDLLARAAAAASERCGQVGMSSWRNHLRHRGSR